MKKHKMLTYQHKALQTLLPPEDLKVSEWAEKYRIMDSKSSAIPGPWRNETTPYLIEIMDELLNPYSEEIVFVKPTQVGGTETLQNMVGFIICQDPSPTMIVYPIEVLAESVATNRLRPMFKLSPAIRHKYFFKQSSKIEHQFEGMYLSLNGANSPSILKWEAIIKQFKEPKKQPEILKTFVNTVLGETWVERGEAINEDILVQHTYRYDCEVPEKVLLLTAGVDVQDDRLEVEVVGWAEGEESWGVEYAVLLGDPRQSGVWKSLDGYLFKAFYYADGRKINISCTCIDSGGHATDEVYFYCRSREQLRVFAIKGKGGFGVPMTDRPHRNNKFKCLLFILGVDGLKDLFHARLRISQEGAGYCHFPIEGEKGYTEDILKGFISEQKFREPNKNGTYKYVWKKKAACAMNRLTAGITLQRR